MPEQCSERVWRTGEFRSSACVRAGIVERNGKRYCKQHDPVAVSARRNATNAKWEARLAANSRQHARAAANTKIAAIAVRLVRQAATYEELAAAVAELEAIGND